jgi:restriction system protein
MGSKKELTAAATDALLKLDHLSQQDMERLVTGAYRVRGYLVRTDDAGDLLLTKDDQRLLLQCKHWKTRKVGEMAVRELYGSMAAHSASGGVMISSGAFTLEASRFANFGGIELLDALKLKALLHRPSDAPAHSPAARSMAG